MKWNFLKLLLIIFIIQNISALCGENQININTATEEGLDALKGIGPAKAEAIINSRPFNSVDELINVKGIGEVTLNNINEQGLACVNDEETEVNNESEIISEIDDSSEENNVEEKEQILNQELSESRSEEIINQKIENSVIKLTPKTIKSEENIETLNKNNYAIYGFVVFCILLAFLFLLKRKKFKNEFN
jgi:competence ComEA-like helix-hairpin-helix protein